MKKGIFTILSLVLMASSTFGSDRVLYKMVITATSSQSIAGKASTEGDYEAVDIKSHCFTIGGGATLEYYNNGSTDNMIFRDSIRLANSESYIHISLAKALQAGDVIAFKSARSYKVYMNKTSDRTRVATVGNDLKYTVTNSESGLKGATDLYIWRDQNGEQPYFREILITTNSEEVVYYDFEDETVTEFAQQAEVVLNNGLRVNSNLASGRSSIISNSVAGYTKALNIAGDGINRALKLNVTDPCDIEVWAVSASAIERSLYITDDASDLDKATLYTTTDDNKAKLVRSTYRFDGYANSTDLIISPSTGSWKIIAIRVIYDRIRPAANLSVSPASAVIRRGESQTFTYNKDHESATITRGKKDSESLADWINVSEVANTSVTVSPKDAGIGHTYVMKITQNANAHCRAAEVLVPIRLVAANESLEDIVATDGTLTNSTVWTSDDNMTLIADAAETNSLIKYGTAVGEFAANTAFRLAAGKDFTISVPSNKQISRITFSGYSVTGESGTGSIQVNGVNTAFNAVGGAIKDIVYSDINAQKFSFKVYNHNIAVKISVATTDLGHYPVTIGSSNWASFCAPEDVELPEGVFAYTAESKGKNAEDEDVVVVNKVESSTIPAGGYLLYSETAGDYELNATTGAPVVGTNLLVGTSARTAKPAEGTTYVLNSDGCLAPYTGSYIPANKAYLHIPADPAGAPKKLRLVVGGHNMPTGVESVQNSAIRSQKVIENGQLVIIKNGVRYNAQGQIVK